ncbi:maltose ABC transporter substrate-binding protein [Paenibacillus thermotolerans]|uniref:maltose ABC transporter substrate-binding protein n=1 Tax=Paenibacillus thermotolerans TaxID=3027807 RepID=UPI002368DF32|nr:MULTISPECIES: maltose ABC transporter substrate-binding protein [unclassified Paenibacillus]
MLKMKPWFAMVLAVVLAFSLAACGSKTNDETTGADDSAAVDQEAPADDTAASTDLVPEEGAKLLIWESADQKAFIEAVGKAFTEKYGVPVEWVDVGPDKSMAQMITDGPAGVGADVFAAVHDRTGSGAAAGVILPNDVFEQQTKDSAYQTAIDAVTYDGMLYGYPYSVETTAVYYNKDLIPEVPADWNGVVEFAKTFNNVNEQKYAYMWEAGNGYWSYGFFGGYGAYVFGNNGTDVSDIGLNSDNAVEAAKFFQSLRDILPFKTGDINGDVKKSLFEKGQLAMNVSGPWDKETYKQLVPNLGVAPYPNLPNGQPMKPFSGVKAYYVNAHSKFPIAARLFAQMASSAEWQKKNYEMTGVLPADKTLGEDPLIKNDPISAGFLKQFENSVPMPSIPEMANYWAPMESALATMWNDGADPKKTMDNMVKQFKDLNATAAQ